MGAYTLTAEIAQGELSTVFLATRTAAGSPTRRAVFRRLRAELREIPEWRALLADELRITGAVHHPNVVSQLADSAEAPELTPFEYIDGETLEFLLARSEVSLKPKLLVPIFADVLRGLAAVHSAQTVDGKPLLAVHQAPRAHHIVVGTDGGSRLIDFTQALHSEARASRARADRLQLGYMAPEQALDPDNVDRRADLFIVGIALWEALTGERLFRADLPQDSYQNMLHRTVPKASTVGRKPPDAFDPLLARALQREPDKRFQNAADMQAAVIAAGRALGGPASAFEVGQWVMAIAGATLRARHGQGASPSVAPRGTSVRPPPGVPEVTEATKRLGADGEKSIPAGTPIKVARPPASVRPASMRPSTPASGAAKSLLQTQRSLDGTGATSGSARVGETPDVSAKPSGEKEQPPARPSDTAVLRMVPVSSPPSQFGLQTMVGGYSIAPAPGSEPPPKSDPPGAASKSARSRVHTLQAIAAVSLDAIAAHTKGSQPRDSEPESPERSGVPRDVPPNEPGGQRTPSDVPTEILTPEQARELAAALAGERAPQTTPAPPVGGTERNRQTQQLFVMPENPAPQGLTKDPRRAAGGSSSPPAPSALTPSAPEETVVADMSALPAELLKASTAPTAPPPDASPAKLPAAPRLPSTDIVIATNISGVLMPVSAKARRAPIHVAEETAELAVHSSLRPSEGPSRGNSIAPYSGSRREPSGRYDASLHSFIFVPTLEENDGAPGVWDDDAASKRPSRSAPSARPSTKPGRSGWAWGALFVALAVVGGVIALGAGTPVTTDHDFEEHLTEPSPGSAVPNPPTPSGTTRSAAIDVRTKVPALPSAVIDAGVPSSPAPGSAILPSVPAADDTAAAASNPATATSSRHRHGFHGSIAKPAESGAPDAGTSAATPATKPADKPAVATPPPDENVADNPY